MRGARCMSYKPKEVITMIKDYEENVRLYNRLMREQNEDREQIGVQASKFGIESTMPHANTISNPTQKAAERLLIKEGMIERTKKKIDFIDKRSKRIHKNQHIVTIALRTQGFTSAHIGRILDVSRTRVQNIVNEVAQLMCKNEEEYKLYCAKKNITPVDS